MNDSAAGEAVILIGSFVAFFLPFVMAPFIIGTMTKEGRKAYQAISGGLKNAASRSANLGKRAAMNTKYGQAAQQFMGNRKSIAALKGRETLRGTLNKNPNLAKLMGGAGGQQYANRFLNQENRKHQTEQIQELSKNISLPMANAIAGKENLIKARNSGQWANGKKLQAEELEGIRQMQAQGYIGSDGTVGAGHPHSAIVASAALQEIYSSDDVTAEKVAGLGSMLRGAGTEANSEFTKLNRDLAVRGKNKNVAFAAFNDGKIDQFNAKGPSGIVASGLQGMNKDALKPSNHDLDANGNDSGSNALLDELHKVTHDASGARDYSAIIERTKQTMDQNHQEVLKGLSDAMGFASVEEFKELRTALTSGGGTQALPPAFRTAMGGNTPITPPATPSITPPAGPPPAGYTQAPGSPLVVPHGPAPAPAPRPRPGGNFNGPGNPPPANPGTP